MSSLSGSIVVSSLNEGTHCSVLESYLEVGSLLHLGRAGLGLGSLVVHRGQVSQLLYGLLLLSREHNAKGSILQASRTTSVFGTSVQVHPGFRLY